MDKENFILDLVTELRQATDQTEHWNICHRAYEKLGVSSLLYGIIAFPNQVHDLGYTQSTTFRHSYPQEWMDAFGGSEVFLDNDFSVEFMFNNGLDFLWHHDNELEAATAEQLAQFEFEHALGMETGVSLSLARPQIEGLASGVGCWTKGISVTEFDEYWAENCELIKAVSFLLDTGMRAHRWDSFGNLTDREREALQYFARGFRRDETAHRMGIAVKTLDKHIESAKKKLDSSTRDQAVSKAMIFNLISP